MLGTAEVLMLGANKYGDRNWELGIDYSRVYGAILRHLFAWFSGEDCDKETSKNHLHHASCELMFLQHFISNDKYKKFDNRSKQ